MSEARVPETGFKLGEKLFDELRRVPRTGARREDKIAKWREENNQYAALIRRENFGRGDTVVEPYYVLIRYQLKEATTVAVPVAWMFFPCRLYDPLIGIIDFIKERMGL
jgi:hypothetical protein